MKDSKPENEYYDRREQSYKAAKALRAGLRELERQMNSKRSRKTR